MRAGDCDVRLWVNGFVWKRGGRVVWTGSRLGKTVGWGGLQLTCVLALAHFPDFESKRQGVKCVAVLSAWPELHGQAGAICYSCN